MSSAYTFPLNKNPKRPTEPRKHVVEDIRFRKPFFVKCTCGWESTEARSSQEVEGLWKAHKAAVLLDLEPTA